MIQLDAIVDARSNDDDSELFHSSPISFSFSRSPGIESWEEDPNFYSSLLTALAAHKENFHQYMSIKLYVLKINGVDSDPDIWLMWNVFLEGEDKLVGEFNGYCGLDGVMNRPDDFSF